MQLQKYVSTCTTQGYACREVGWDLISGYFSAISPSLFSKHQWAECRFLQINSTESDSRKKDGTSEVFFYPDWKISEDTIARPDVRMICGAINQNKNRMIPPVITVEMFSQTSYLKDRNIKFNLCQQCGVIYYMMAGPDSETIKPFKLADNNHFELKRELPSELTKSGADSFVPEQLLEA